MFELAQYLEKETFSKNNNIEYIEKVEKTNNISDKLSSDFLISFQNLHSPFLSKVTTEENVQLPKDLKGKIVSISTELNFGQNIQNEIQKLLTKVYINSKEKITLSKTAEGEFLIYTNINGTYKNVLIDEDGDIEVLIIPPDRSHSYSKRFYQEDGINFSSVFSTFNEV